MKASILGVLAAVIGGESGPEAVQLAFMKQIYSTVDADPTAITPDDPTIAALWYQDPSVGTGTNVWIWGIVSQAWAQFSV